MNLIWRWSQHNKCALSTERQPVNMRTLVTSHRNWTAQRSVSTSSAFESRKKKFFLYVYVLYTLGSERALSCTIHADMREWKKKQKKYSLSDLPLDRWSFDEHILSPYKRNYFFFRAISISFRVVIVSLRQKWRKKSKRVKKYFLPH